MLQILIMERSGWGVHIGLKRAAIVELHSAIAAAKQLTAGEPGEPTFERVEKWIDQIRLFPARDAACSARGADGMSVAVENEKAARTLALAALQAAEHVAVSKFLEERTMNAYDFTSAVLATLRFRNRQLVTRVKPERGLASFCRPHSFES